MKAATKLGLGVVVVLWTFAMVILTRVVLNSDLGPGWIWLWTIVVASIAAGGILYLILWLFEEKDGSK